MSDQPPHDYSAELKKLGELASAFDFAEAKRLAETHGESLQKLAHAYLCLRYLIERGDVNSSAPKGIRILYAKMVEGVGAILLLLRNGLSGPAAQIFRSTLETSVHLQVILRDEGQVPERSRLFEEFLVIQRHETYSGPSVTDEQRAKNEEEFQHVKANYHPTHRFSWAWKVCPSKKLRKGVTDNPNLKDLCEFIGHPDYYEQLYGPLSDTTHPVPGYENWLRGQDKNMYVGPKTSEHVAVLAWLTVIYSMDTLLRMLDFLKPADADALRVFYAVVLLEPDSSEEQSETMT
jgi:hypothetical protein